MLSCMCVLVIHTIDMEAIPFIWLVTKPVQPAHFANHKPYATLSLGVEHILQTTDTSERNIRLEKQKHTKIATKWISKQRSPDKATTQSTTLSTTQKESSKLRGEHIKTTPSSFPILKEVAFDSKQKLVLSYATYTLHYYCTKSINKSMSGTWNLCYTHVTWTRIESITVLKVFG